MKAILVVLETVETAKHFVLDRFPTVIGRSPDVEITLDDRWVSRRHCQIDAVEGALVVRDLDSKHGTMVNNHLVREAALLPGDKLTIGLSSFVASYQRRRDATPDDWLPAAPALPLGEGWGEGRLKQ